MSWSTVAWFVLAFTLGLQRPASTQCCCGAQDCAATSADGRFQVAARSTLGTGGMVHGPYAFEFTTWRLEPDGSKHELGRFERTWDTTAHFHMSLHVPSTGNGFLLSSSLEDDLVFHAPDGLVLRRLAKGDGGGVWSDPATGSAGLLRAIVGGDRGLQQGLLWLPLAMMVGAAPGATDERWSDEPGVAPWTIEAQLRFRRALHWHPERGERERAAAEAAVRAWLAPGGSSRELEALRELGLSAMPILQAWPAPDDATRSRLRRAIDCLRRDLAGFEAPWCDLELLVAMLAHPDAEWVAAGRRQLARVLPAGAECSAAWVAAHRDRLRLDDRRARYELGPK